MRILYVFFGKPGNNYGGGIGSSVIQHCLTQIADVDYIGPALDESYLKESSIKFNSLKTLSGKSGKIKRVLEFIFHKALTFYYDSWKKTVVNVNPNDYDCCFVEYTTFPFVINWAKKNNLKTIARGHNVETDYTKSLYKNNKTLKNLFVYLMTKKLEASCLKKLDYLLPITQFDESRFKRLFQYKYKSFIIPVAMKSISSKNEIKKNRPVITMIGSLWFGPNADGAEWFLKEVWSKVNDNICKEYDLIIAGAKPRNEISVLVKQLSNVYLYPSPEDISIFYNQADIFVAPIFYGSGMKIKVAEALSYGLEIIASSHALIGYEAAKGLTHKADTVDEYIDCLKKLCSESKEVKEENKNNILDCFERNYSISAIEQRYKAVFTEICGEKN